MNVFSLPVELVRSVHRSNSRLLFHMARKVVDSFLSDPGISVTAFGKKAVWHIVVANLRPGAIVYSGGVGKDISMELELVKETGCEVFLFDPSPTGRETMALPANQDSRIHYSAVGLAGRGGKLRFSPPELAVEGSYRLPASEQERSVCSEFECIALSEFARAHGHERVHLLKLDIEGFEYDVLEDVLERGPQIDQICVEFHHFLPGVSARLTANAVRRLREKGFRLIFKSGLDFTFLRVR